MNDKDNLPSMESRHEKHLRDYFEKAHKIATGGIIKHPARIKAKIDILNQDKE